MSAEKHKNGCTVTVFQTVDVAAEITVRPHVSCGPAHILCEENWVVPCREDHPWGDRSLPLPEDCDKECTFWVIQRLCVAIPVRFDADATCTDKHIVCSPASTDPCRHGAHDVRSDDACSSGGCSGESWSAESSGEESGSEVDESWSGDDESDG